VQILIIGANSFIGKNLRVVLLNHKYNRVVEINNCDDIDKLKRYVDESDFIFHLSTVYRSDDELEFERINIEKTKKIVDFIGKQQKSLILLSSTQVGNGTPYGESKLYAEECVKEWMRNTQNKAYIFRLGNEFGKWCPPYLNSVIATFCHNVANGKEITVNSPDAKLNLMYIDDIIKGFIDVIEGRASPGYCDILPVYETTVREVAEIIKTFPEARKNSDIPNIEDKLIKKLYSTFLSYLPLDEFSYPLKTHTDERGTFTELAHIGEKGQVSVNISKPGITKGNHWHHTKTEKFIVVAGEGTIKFRKVNTSEVTTYRVSGTKIEVVDIPPGYTHNITNVGDTDMITIMWANEIFDLENPDTYFEEV